MSSENDPGAYISRDAGRSSSIHCGEAAAAIAVVAALVLAPMLAAAMVARVVAVVAPPVGRAAAVLATISTEVA